MAGLAINKELSLNAIRTETLIPPYDEIIRGLKAGKDLSRLVEQVGIHPIQSAMDASKSLNGLTPDADWLGILEKSANLYQAGHKLEKKARKLQQGEFVDLSDIVEIVGKAELGLSARIPMDQVVGEEIPYKECGFAPIDAHLGGLPATGLVIAGGAPGSGKTTLSSAIAGCYARKYSEERVVVYSVEMLASQYAARTRQVMDLTEREENRIEICDEPFTSSEIISDAARVDNLGLVIIDFADLIIEGETGVATMSDMYLALMMGAKKLRVPILLLSQLSGGYKGGIPRPNHLRWTRLAEALAYMVLMVYNPSIDYFAEQDSDKIPIIDERAYIIAWKCRGGFRKHRDDSPGAIQIPFKGNKGWKHDDTGEWFNLRKYI